MEKRTDIGADVEQIKKVLSDITKSILQILGTSAGDEVKKKRRLSEFTVQLNFRFLHCYRCQETFVDDLPHRVNASYLCPVCGYVLINVEREPV